MRIRQGCSTALALLVISVCGCGDASKESSKPTVQPPVKDESLTSDEYIRLGLVAYDRVWSGDDFARAARVFTSFGPQGYRKLPRYKSERSGDVFKRLTFPQNLNSLRDETRPLDERISESLTHFDAINQILKLYLAAFQKQDVRDSEVVELMGALLRLSVVTFELFDEFVAALDKSDPTYPDRMAGLVQVKQGLARVVAGSLQTLTERDSYRSSELARFVTYMQETFPLLFPRLLPEACTESMTRLKQIEEDPAMKDLQPALKKLHSEVKSALAKAVPDQRDEQPSARE